METIGAFEAKTNLGKILDRVEKGEQILISRHGRPIARIVPYEGKGQNEIVQAMSEIRKVRESTKKFSKGELQAFVREGRKH